jgi:hypothetical protein
LEGCSRAVNVVFSINRVIPHLSPKDQEQTLTGSHQRRSSPRHVPSSAAPAAHPTRAGPLLAPSRRAATTRATMHATGLASRCFARAVLLLVLKLAQESLLTSFTHSTMQHCFFFLPPLNYPRRSSTAASAHHRQLPPSPPTHDPVL